MTMKSNKGNERSGRPGNQGRLIHPVDICFDQAGVNNKAMTTDQTFRDTAGDGGFEHRTQQIAVPKLTMRYFVKAE